MIALIGRDDAFPPLEAALESPNGLLAVGGDLSPGRLLAAYRQGIFPWYEQGQPILWWSPDPRMVLLVAELKVRRSLAKVLRARRFELRVDSAFRTVVERCAGPRPGQDGTWITPAMIEAYTRLHGMGYAHSVEAWRGGTLVGGLYGVAIGRMFFGESMFSRETDASKVALVALARMLAARGFPMIDCQQQTGHLASMGARPMPRTEFACRISELVHCEPPSGPWTLDDAPE